tara:strand:- start:1464 stop:3365 length:1902 start_codon:yes stop_codon:yes gene_type:complete
MLALKRFLNLRRGRINARKEVRKQLRIRGRLENDVFKKINTLFRTQLRKTSNEFKITDRFDPEIFVRETSAVMEAVMNQHYKKIFRIIYRNNEEQYDRGRKDEEVFVFGRAKDFERLINSYFRTRTPYFSNMSSVMARAIQKQVQQGRVNNLNLDQIARNITGLTKLGRGRASVIARTETHNAASFANHEYHRTASSEYGIEMVKRWVATGDARTRSAHAQANGQTVPMDEKFKVGGADMEYAGDPAGGVKNVVNCRCVIVYVEPEDQENIIEDEEFIDANDYGETEPSEFERHRIGKWEGEKKIRDLIRIQPPLKNGVQKGNSSYYSPYKAQIHMKNSRHGSDYDSGVWRHEYGHFIDNNVAHLEKIKRSTFVNRYKLESGGVRHVADFTGNFSTLAATSVRADKKVLSAMNRKNKKKWEETYKESTIYYKQDFTEELGFKFVTGEGYVYKGTKKELAVKIRKFLKDTDGFVDTDFLDGLLGKEWAENIIGKAVRFNGASTDVFYANNLFDTLTHIKMNFSEKRNTFINDIARTALRMGKIEEASDIVHFSDFVGSVTNNLYLEGHSASYYARGMTIVQGVKDDHMGESFANYISLMGGKYSSIWRKTLESLTPATMKDYDDFIDFLLDPST